MHMKMKKEVLDVDIIGSQDTLLTQEEELALKEFFLNRKMKSAKLTNNKEKAISQKPKPVV